MYKIQFEGIDEFIKDMNNLEKSLEETKFMKHLAEKAEKSLNKTTRENLSNVEKGMSFYANNNKKEVGKNHIILYNNTKADISNMSKETQSNYPNGFSIAKAIEYGTGIVGKNSAIDVGENWAYDVNNHGEKGWYYEKNGSIYWSKGMSGKFIYYKTKKNIEKNIGNWVHEYIKNGLKKR